MTENGLANLSISSESDSPIAQITSSNNNTTSDRKLIAGAASLRGKRDKNEDAHVIIFNLPTDPSSAYFAVFDGHGGKSASHYCKEKMHRNITERKCYKDDKKKAITKGFLKTDEKYIGKMKPDGCTALVALLTEDNKLYVGNAGDSRCVMYQDGKTAAITIDHKPNDSKEKARIEAAGHEVSKETILVNGKREYVWRVDGVTAVSRSIGDSDYKDSFSLPPEQQAITCSPDVFEANMKPGDFFVMACDGVWDVMSNEQVTQYIKTAYETEKDLNKVAQSLAEEAIKKGSEDNITVVIVVME